MALFAVLLSLASVATVSLAGVVPVGAPVAAPLNAAYPFAPAAYAVPNGLAYSSAGLAYASPYAAYTSPLAARALASPFAYSPYAAAYPAPLASPYVAAPVARAVAAPYVAAPVARTVAAPLVAAPAAVAPVARAAVVAAAAPIEADAYPQYNFAYTVQDSLTGDSKSQEESRDGGVVKGSYSLIEPDGVRRTVNYYADPINGFNAVVQRDLPVAAIAAVKAAPAIVAV